MTKEMVQEEESRCGSRDQLRRRRRDQQTVSPIDVNVRGILDVSSLK